MTLSRTNHAKILTAYLSRMTLGDLRRIVAADEECWRAQANLGNSAQIEAQENFRKIASQSVDNIIDHDLETIESVLADIFGDLDK